MKPFHEIEPIPYEEFLNIIQKNTGLTSWRAKISRGDFGVIPTEEKLNPLLTRHVNVSAGATAEQKRLLNITNILNHISDESIPLIKGGISWSDPKKISNLLGWTVIIHKRFIGKTLAVERLIIQYLFREGLKGQSPPDDEDDYYNIGQDELIGWVFDMDRINRNESGEIINFVYMSGLKLYASHAYHSDRVYYVHSESADILKEVFQSGFFSEFLNWNEGNPLEVKQ